MNAPIRQNAFARTNPSLYQLREEFLAKQGWDERVMARHKLTVSPNVALESNTPTIWNSKFHGQLGGYPYVAIPYHNLRGDLLMRHVSAVGAEIPFVRARLLEWRIQI